MKKLIMAAIAAFSMITLADTTDVYDFKLSAKVPFLKTGIRTYSTQAMKGYLQLTWDDDGFLIGATGIVQNTKTKVNHIIDFTEGFYNLMGKSNKKIERCTPTVFLNGKEIEPCCSEIEGHEFIKDINLAGTGSLTFIKGTGCSACGDTTSDCNKLAKISGNFVGIMDCMCPDDETWNHTVEASNCGIKYVDEEYIRTHDAAFWGTWSISLNKKLSK